MEPVELTTGKLEPHSETTGTNKVTDTALATSRATAWLSIWLVSVPITWLTPLSIVLYSEIGELFG